MATIPGSARALLLVVACATACTVGPDYEPPRPETPDAWHLRLTRGLDEGTADLRTWWTLLEDPFLSSLVGRAFEGNLDLRRAVARVERARAGVGIAKGERVPQVNGVGAAQRRRFSGNILSDPATGQNLGFGDENLFSLGLDSSWELDFWGRIRRSVEASTADYYGSIEAYRDVLVTLLADTATTYVDVRTLQERLDFARKNAELQRGALQLTSDRRNAGLVGDLDVRQAELNLGRTESLVPRLEQDLATAIHRLGVLTGELPGSLYAELEAVRPIPQPPERVVVGLPTELLRQRPDIRTAERALAAETARIGLVTADLYPRFSLSGTFTVDSTRGYNLFDWSSRAFGLGPTLQWNLFSGGRVRSRIRSQEARAQEALAFYEQTVLRGYEEVENALVAFVREQARRDALQRSVNAAGEAVRLVDELYRLGLTDFQNVLDTQRLLFEQEDELAGSRGLVTRNLIRLYRAVGGGWSP